MPQLYPSRGQIYHLRSSGILPVTIYGTQAPLHNAVLTLGAQIRNAGGLFWVDAVCIDQQHVPGKSFQVALMTSILREHCWNSTCYTSNRLSALRASIVLGTAHI